MRPAIFEASVTGSTPVAAANFSLANPYCLVVRPAGRKVRGADVLPM